MNELRILKKDGKIKIFLDEFEVEGVQDFELKCSSAKVAELTLKINVKL